MQSDMLYGAQCQLMDAFDEYNEEAVAVRSREVHPPVISRPCIIPCVKVIALRAHAQAAEAKAEARELDEKQKSSIKEVPLGRIGTVGRRGTVGSTLHIFHRMLSRNSEAHRPRRSDASTSTSSGC